MEYHSKLLTSSDAKQISDVHFKSFPNFFLTSLGKNFLFTFYKSVLSSNHGLGVGYFYKNQLIAFSIGTTLQHGFYRSLIIKNGFRLFWAALPSLVLDPPKLFRIVNSLGGSNESPLEKSALLLSICTLPEYQGYGMGGKIIQEFENVALASGMTGVVLTTDHFNNDYANTFYISKNYKILNVFDTNMKRKMNRYYKNLTN
jgi:GNAT superfamily N-acetyltransferase